MAIIVSAALLLGGAFNFHGDDAAGHVGTRTAQAAEHHHGDSDDHHDGPGGSCHHALHCASGHAQPFLSLPRAGGDPDQISTTFSLPPCDVREEPVAAPPFHVPIA